MTRMTPFLITVFGAVCLWNTVGCALAQSPPAGDPRTCYQSVAPYKKIRCAKTDRGGRPAKAQKSLTDNGDGSVTDNRTGLTWQKQDDGEVYNWFHASGTKDEKYNPDGVDVCAPFGRLPSKDELLSLAETSIAYPGPTIHPVFTNTKASGYWTATTVEGREARAWIVGFSRHNALFGGKGLPYYVRCVKGDMLPGHPPK